jgi:transposase
MSKPKKSDPKEKALRECGALNTHPVADALFKGSDFFDSRDLVQVKYEMLRKVHKEAEPVSSAAAAFGFSRPSFYKSVTAFERDGLMGLLPRKRGPRSGHKLTAEVLEFAKELLSAEEPIGIASLLNEVERQFGVRVHRRSLERAIRRSEKKMFQIRAKKQKQAP